MLTSRRIKQIIREAIFDVTATPHISKTDAQRELGINPLRTDVGGHAANDEVRQVSTFDYNGANFRGTPVVLSDNRFTFYKVKNFGNPDVRSTKQFFGDTANGEKDLRKEIDKINGAATRNGKSVIYRIITNAENLKKNKGHEFVTDSFWEFSFDGNTWYILKPNCVNDMKQSSIK